MAQQVKASKAVEIDKGGHTYTFMKVSRAYGGHFYLACRDNGKMKMFNSKGDIANHYPSIASEIRRMKI